MARARNIKPGTFKNEILGEADPLYTLLFVGLWTLADREGRLEDRPLRIKGELFPYRNNVDIDAMLFWLQDKEFIIRYMYGKNRYIQILNFKKHQNPHKNEQASEIPEYSDGCSTTEKIGTSTEKIGSTRADSLIPDSLSSDSLIPDSGFRIPEVCAEPKIVSTPPPQNVVISIPLLDGSEYPIADKQLEEFQELYQGIDVLQSMRKCRAWNISNPKHRKTKSGVMRHVNAWLAKDQNASRPNAQARASPAKASLSDRNQAAIEEAQRLFRQRRERVINE